MSHAVTLDEIGQIHITVDDLPRMVDFYRDVLGMSFLFQVPGQSMAFFDCGGIRLYLGKAESEALRSNPLVYYRVASITDAYRALLERGAEALSEPHVVHSSDTADLWVAGIHDPEANAVLLMSEVEK